MDTVLFPFFLTCHSNIVRVYNKKKFLLFQLIFVVCFVISVYHGCSGEEKEDYIKCELWWKVS